MLIHEISFQNVRGVTNFHLANIPERGVLVISGDNEAGKSTVLEAVWTVLFERHKANNKNVKPMRPAGRDVPMVISLTATVGPVRFRITKQYFKSAKAELTIFEPRRASYTGGDADAQLEHILSEHLDRTLLETLFVRQGDVEAAFAAAGIPSLSQALDAADSDGQQVASEDTGLIDAVAKEYARYYTANTGKPTGELKDAITAHEAAVAACEAAGQKENDLESDIAAYARDEVLLAGHTAQIPDAEREVSERRATLAQAEAVQSKVTALGNELEHARTLADAAHNEVERRKQLHADVAAAEKQVVSLEATREPLAAEIAEQQEKVATCKRELSEAESALSEARTALADTRTAIDLRHRHARMVELREFLTSVAEKDEAIAHLRLQLPARIISAADVSRAEELGSTIAVAQAKADALSAKLRLSATAGTTISIDGEEVEVGSTAQERVLRSATTVVIGGVTAEFIPEGSNEVALAELDTLTRQRSELMEQFGVQGLDELREWAGAHAELLADIQKLETERTAVIGQRDIRQLQVEYDNVQRELAGADLPTESLDSLRVQEAELAEKLAGHDESVAELRVELRALESADKQVELVSIDTRLGVESERCTALRQQLASAEEIQSLEKLVAVAAEQQEKVAALFQQLDELTANTADVDEARELLAGGEARLESLKKSIAAAELRMAERRGNILRAQGVAEERLRAEAEREATEQRLARVRRRADAADLLLRTLRFHLEAARKRYSAPFVAKLGTLSRSLFGTDLDFVVDEELKIAQRVTGDIPIDLSSLSGGAKEQLALLARCAVSELVDANDGVPIFIDDALGHTDSQRLVHMNRVLSNLGKERQVIVLTSMPDRFARVTGAETRTMDELKAGAS